MRIAGIGVSNLAALAGLVLALEACESKGTQDSAKGAKGPSKTDRAVVVDAVVAQVSQSPVEVSGAGTLLPLDEIDLKAEASGRIASLHLQEGKKAAAGELLVKIDDAVLQAQRSKALSQVHRFGALAERRKQELALKAVSQQEADLAQADLEAAQADLKLVDAQIRNTEIRAPFAGRLGLRNVSVGEVVSVGQVLGRLTRMRPLQVELSVPEAKAAGLREGVSLSFRVLGRLDRFTARIDAVEPRLDIATRSLRIRARYDGPVDLVPGSSVTALLERGARSGILVPPEALSGDAHGAILYVGKGGRIRAVRPAIGIREADKVEIVSGIEVGDTVLVAGASSLVPGKSFKIASIEPSP